MNTLTNEELDAVTRLLIEKVQGASNMVHAVYIPPAAQLRRQADAIEQAERDYPLLQSALRKLQAV